MDMNNPYPCMQLPGNIVAIRGKLKVVARLCHLEINGYRRNVDQNSRRPSPKMGKKLVSRFHELIQTVCMQIIELKNQKPDCIALMMAKEMESDDQ